MSVIREGIFPFTFRERGEDNDLDLAFEDCTFTEDFGEIKKGTHFDWITVSIDCGYIICGNDEPEEIVDLRFKISHNELE